MAEELEPRKHRIQTGYGRYEAINISAKTEKQNAGIIVISPVENILTI